MAGSDDKTIINKKINYLWILELAGGREFFIFVLFIPSLFVQLFTFVLFLVGQKYPVELNVSYNNLSRLFEGLRR